MTARYGLETLRSKDAKLILNIFKLKMATLNSIKVAILIYAIDDSMNYTSLYSLTIHPSYAQSI